VTRIKFGAEFRLRYALATEFVCHRKSPKALRSSPVTTMNSARNISPFRTPPGLAEKVVSRWG
jgi:hypothetical protein